MNTLAKTTAATIEDVSRITKALPFMSLAQATWIVRLIQENRLTDILEIGFYHGVSTCYFASAIAALSGHVTSIDIPFSATISPTAEEVLRACNLESFVTLFRESAGAAWPLMKMIEAKKQFDFCYIDDNHSWSVTGLHFFLVEKLLKPGGYILFDDLKWTIAASRIRRLKKQLADNPARFPPSMNTTGHDITEEQKETPQVGKVWELLVKQHQGFFNFQEIDGFGLCQKRL